ncbi:nuclear envelope pore membrane protein POM 121 isoform X2 [Carcharodon carcharias]|uniref:nuclear envelope pore membrane protein POM 121 isoform X2 n=1 Tax=Carcharodon carcharias TaxID=13397 RepID=UPI001B7E5384|nr:nuclear envelope pore membrane protein POM 121 isoform X2 [Carcharodon carcharias]
MSPAHKRSVITWAAGLSFALLLSFYILGWYLLGLLAVAPVWVYYSSLQGVGPRPGPRVLLDRTKAFLLGTRWAEVVHSKLNGGGGQWRGRGRSARSRSQPGLWNPGRAQGNSCKWEVVNCEERNPLAAACASERSPANLMMGSYLSNENSAQPTFGSRELKNRYSRPNPIQTPTRRLSFGEHQAMMNKFTVTPRRRYPIHQPQYSVPGTLPTVRWDGYQKKNVLSSRNSPMVHSPVTVKIARPDASIMRSPLFDYMMSPTLSPLIDPCSKATVLSALKESRKRTVEDDTGRTLISERENKRRRHDSSGSGHSAFEPLLANGAPASLIPKPGTLKRSTNSQCSDDPISKRSRTSSISSLNSTCVGGKHTSPRNPIFSSYSSTRGHVQGFKNYLSLRNASPLSSPASSRSETPERPGKKIREEEVQRSDASTPVKVDRADKDQPVEEETVSPLSKLSPSTVDSSPSEGDGKRKRKIPLLSKRKGDQLTLHPPLELGYTITADDVDSEKKAGLDRIKKALEEKEEPSKSPAPVTTATLPSLSITFTAPAVESSYDPTATSTSISAIVSNPLLASLKKMQNCTNSVTNSDSVDGVTSSNMVKSLEPSVNAFKSDLLPPSTTTATTMTMTTDIAGFKPIDVLNFSCSSITQPLITPINKLATKAITTTTNSCLVSALVSAQESKVSKGPEVSVAASTGSSAPPNTSFSLPSTVTVMPAVIGASAPSSTFKPLFGLPVTNQTSIVSTTFSLAMPVTTPTPLVASITSSPATSKISFKPLFENSPTLATSTTTSAPFTFGQSTQAAVSNETTVLTTSTKSSSTLFPFAPSSTLASSTIDSEAKGSKTTFSFGLSVAVPSKPSTAPNANNNLSSQQLFQFGSNASTTTTVAPSAVFQFGKGSADTATTSAGPLAPAFGQATVVTSQASTSIAPTSNLFGNFGPSVSTPSTTSSGQLALSFGNSAKTSLFGNATSTPPFGGPAAQLNFGGTGSKSTFGTNAVATQQTPSKTPAFGNAVTPFNFGASPAKSAFPSTTSQSTFGTPSQPVFGGATAQTGFGSTSTQPVFGSTSATFSFGTTTSSTAAPIFNATKSSGGGTTGSIFGSSQVVGFGSSNQPVVTTTGFTITASNPNMATAGFFGSSQSGFCSSNPSVPFATSTSTSSSQNMFGSTLTNQGQQNQTTPQFNFGATNAVENKPAFGGFNFGTPSLNFGTGTTAPGFGQSTPSGNFSFGTTGAPASNFGSPGAGAAAASTFATPTFSIGAGSRPTGTRQRLQARRQHVRKR